MKSLLPEQRLYASLLPLAVDADISFGRSCLPLPAQVVPIENQGLVHHFAHSSSSSLLPSPKHFISHHKQKHPTSLQQLSPFLRHQSNQLPLNNTSISKMKFIYAVSAFVAAAAAQDISSVPACGVSLLPSVNRKASN